ncbi:MAG TPA: tetratricopeptide repeat protein [Polyangiaceae bacterium]|nr:tetratricopeptide repeat protein [Polyangiaceae bacterium]
MSHPVDVHPEDLFDREQAGTLTADERRRLNSHTFQCAACALVRTAVRDFAAQRNPAPGDDALIARLSGEALGRAATIASGTISPALRTTYTGTQPRRRRSWAVGAIVLFAATGATASFWSVRGAIVQRLLTTAPAETVAPAAVEPKVPIARAKTAPPAPVVEQPAPVAEEAEPTPVVVTPIAPPPIAAPRARAPELVNVPPPVLAPAADELFAAANEARRRGDPQKSFELYTELSRRYPGTREETTSRVLLGRLLLDRGGDPTQALGLFTRYLDESPGGTLAEEARLGRALALTRLGSAKEERQAWQQLLAFHPNSIHAERARKRLDELH